jgi:hypothetical protein
MQKLVEVYPSRKGSIEIDLSLCEKAFDFKMDRKKGFNSLVVAFIDQHWLKFIKFDRL